MLGEASLLQEELLEAKKQSKELQVATCCGHTDVLFCSVGSSCLIDDGARFHRRTVPSFLHKESQRTFWAASKGVDHDTKRSYTQVEQIEADKKLEKELLRWRLSTKASFSREGGLRRAFLRLGASELSVAHFGSWWWWVQSLLPNSDEFWCEAGPAHVGNSIIFAMVVIITVIVVAIFSIHIFMLCI